MDPDLNKTPQKKIFLKIKMNHKVGVFLGCYKLFVFPSCCHSNRNVFIIEANNSACHSPPEIIPSSFENFELECFHNFHPNFEVLAERENAYDIENNICCKKLCCICCRKPYFEEYFLAITDRLMISSK